VNKESGGNKGSTPLIKAASAGLVDTVGILIESRAEVDQMTKQQHTAMNQAAWHNQPEGLRALIQHRGDINMETPEGTTPLIKAAANGATKAIKMLVDTHAEVDYECANGYTALLRAAGDGQPESVMALVSCYAKVNRESKKSHFTALMKAAANGHEDCVQVQRVCGCILSKAGYSMCLLIASRTLWSQPAGRETIRARGERYIERPWYNGEPT